MKQKKFKAEKKPTEEELKKNRQQKKKELKKSRQQVDRKDMFDVISRSKQVWEELRRYGSGAVCPGLMVLVCREWSDGPGLWVRSEGLGLWVLV